MLRQANEHLELANSELARAREGGGGVRRMKTRFAINVSHELQYPAQSHHRLRGHDGSPRRDLREPLPASYRGDLETIYRNAQHLRKLIDDVLDLSQMRRDAWAGAGGVPLSSVVGEAVEIVAGVFPRQRAWRERPLPEVDPIVHVDRTRTGR